MFREWTCGELRVEHPTKPFRGPGKVELRSDGQLSISVASSPFNGIDFHDVRIVGATDEGCDVIAEHAFSHTQTSNISTAGASGTTHFTAFECEVRVPGYTETAVTREVYHLKNAKLFGRGSFERPPTRVTLRDAAFGKFVPGHISASLALEHSTVPDRLTYLDLSSLLRVATRSLVLAPCKEEFAGDQLIRTVLKEDTRADVSNAPLVSWFGDATASFVDRALDGYRANSANYDLDVMIQYYTFAHTNSTLELQFVFASLFMEGLKFNWAKNVSGLQRDTKANGIIRGFRTAPGQRNLSFEELMNRMAAHLGYTANFTFIEDRNVLFHSGQGAAVQLGHSDPYSVMKPELFVLYDQMEDLLLRILDYRGVVYSRANPDTALEFPARTPAP